jgi:hypothetical protein
VTTHSAWGVDLHNHMLTPYLMLLSMMTKNLSSLETLGPQKPSVASAATPQIFGIQKKEEISTTRRKMMASFGLLLNVSWKICYTWLSHIMKGDGTTTTSKTLGMTARSTNTYSASRLIKWEQLMQKSTTMTPECIPTEPRIKKL